MISSALWSEGHLFRPEDRLTRRTFPSGSSSSRLWIGDLLRRKTFRFESSSLSSDFLRRKSRFGSSSSTLCSEKGTTFSSRDVLRRRDSRFPFSSSTLCSEEGRSFSSRDVLRRRDSRFACSSSTLCSEEGRSFSSRDVLRRRDSRFACSSSTLCCGGRSFCLGNDPRRRKCSAALWSTGICATSLKPLRLRERRIGSANAGAAFLSEEEDGGEERYREEAEVAVGRVLKTAGLSREDAADVVAKAPVFIRELARCIREISEEDDISDTTSESIYQLANQSRGMSPLLESLAVPLPRVSILSRSLSSQHLPDLLTKVRYVKELLAKAEAVPRRRALSGLVEYMMKNLSVSVWDDEDIQRTLTFFEKMRGEGSDRLGALEETSSSLPLLIAAFPQIFKRRLEEEIKPVVRFLEDLGVAENNLGRVLLCFPPILLQDLEKDLLPRKRILKKVGIRVQDMGRMVVKYPWLLSKTVGENVEKVVQFFEAIKVPKSRIDESITRCPQLLGCCTTSALQPMVEHINEFGVKSKRLGRVVAQSPELLIHTPQEFDSVVSFLASVGVEARDISKLMKRSPEIFGTNIDDTLLKKVKFLEDLGVSRSKLGRIVVFFPEVLTMSVESALLPRIQYLWKWGLASHEIARMAFKFPPLLGYNEAVLRPKLEFLTATMRRSVKDVVMYPRYFSHSLEKKIIPRNRVIQNRKIQCDLKTMLAKSDAQFAAEFLGFESLFLNPNKM